LVNLSGPANSGCPGTEAVKRVSVSLLSLDISPRLTSVATLPFEIFDVFFRLGTPLRFLANYMLSPVRLSSVVCNVRAPYSGGSNFRQYFYGIRYLGHPLTSTENFMEIVSGNPSAGGT